MQSGGNGEAGGRGLRGLMSRENIERSMMLSPVMRMKAAHDGGQFDFNHFGWGGDGKTAQGMGAGDQQPAQAQIVHDPGAPDVPAVTDTATIAAPVDDQAEKKSRWIQSLGGRQQRRWKGY